MHLVGLLPWWAVGRKLSGGLTSPWWALSEKGRLTLRPFTSGVLDISYTAPMPSSRWSSCRPGTLLGSFQTDNPGH